MSQSINIRPTPAGPPKRGVFASVTIPKAAGGVNGSVKLCTVEQLSFSRKCVLTKLGVSPDTAAGTTFVYFAIYVNGRLWDVLPYNKIAVGFGTPAAPADLWDELPQGAQVDVYGFNTDTANTYNASGVIQCEEFPLA